MNVLVLNRFRLAYTPYAEWLGPDVRACLITAEAGLPDGGVPDGYAEVVTLADYNDNPAVEWHARRMHAAHRFERIVAMSEFDLLRAARLRELLDIPGQRTDSALPYRDKLLMKRQLSEAGVPVVTWAPVDNALDLIGSAERIGYPLIVKPRLGAGSVGVSRLDNESDLLAFLEREQALRGDMPAGLLAERCVEHRLFHIDGLVADGRVVLCWPAEMTSCLEFYSGEVLVSSLLEADDPLRVPLQQLTGAALAALPTPRLSIFHAEVFRTASGELLLNEIACRIGGGRIKPALRLAFGVDITELYIRAEGGQPIGPLPGKPVQMAGHALFPPRSGVLVEAPTQCPVPGVDQFTMSKQVGDRLEEPHSSVDSLAGATFFGARRSDIDTSTAKLVKWYADAVRIE